MGICLASQARDVAAGVEVAVAPVLAVGHRRRVPAGYPRYRAEQACDVGVGSVQAGAGPDGSRHRAAVAVAHLVPVAVHLLAGQAEQAHQVGMRAEAAVPDPDRLLSGQPAGHQRVRHAVDGERGDWQRLRVRAEPERADAGDRGQALPQQPRDPGARG